MLVWTSLCSFNVVSWNKTLCLHCLSSAGLHVPVHWGLTCICLVPHPRKSVSLIHLALGRLTLAVHTLHGSKKDFTFYFDLLKFSHILISIYELGTSWNLSWRFEKWWTIKVCYNVIPNMLVKWKSNTWFGIQNTHIVLPRDLTF